MSWPLEENAPDHVSFLETPLPNIVLRLNEQVQELEQRVRQAEAKAERYNRALAATEMDLARGISVGQGHMAVGAVLDLLGSIGHYGACGLTTELMDALLQALEKRCA